MAVRAPKRLTPAARAKAKVTEALGTLRSFAPSARAAKLAEGWRVVLTLPTTRRLAEQLNEARALKTRIREARSERAVAERRLERAEGRITALEQILRNVGEEVPQDPPEEPPANGPYRHRMPGSFETRKRR